MDLKSLPNKLATTSLTLGILGWLFYVLQGCFDLTIGVLLAAVTAGSSAVCSAVLDFLTLGVWLAGILAGHVALGQIRQSKAPGRGRAACGLVLGYTGLVFTFLGIAIIIILVAAGVGVGILGKIIPWMPKH